MTEPQEWFTAEGAYGDTRLPIAVGALTDGSVAIRVGHPEVQEYETVLNVDDLLTLIELLQMTYDLAARTAGKESFDG